MRMMAVLLTSVCSAGLTFASSAEITIVLPKRASDIEKIGALEMRRYMYLRTGKIMPVPTVEWPKTGDKIVIAQKDQPLVKDACADARDEATKAEVAVLEPEQYIVKTLTGIDGRKTLLVSGGDAVGVLYGTYRVCEKIGVRFYLHGDVLPEQKRPLAIPEVNESGKPLFNIRGINPFHDFPEGPDWWNQDDYKSYISQLSKMRMNFIGLHCYPDGMAEPLVWIGPKEYLDKENNPVSSFPSTWANTRRGAWGYAAMKTSDFSGGADLMFAGDDYGPDIMAGILPKPETPEACNQLFVKSGNLLKQAFSYAKMVGVKTCIGTETPLQIPKEMREKLKADGKDVNSPEVRKSIYSGMFFRINKICPVDYYWLWTPEGWTWSGNKPEQFDATVKDINAAIEALSGLGNPFTLATCGWVLGPQHDRTALDAVLPKAVPMSCISRQVGHEAVERGFANITGRPKWSIPWLENDPNLIAPQPWVGRMRYDAADSLRLGCTGLIGLHWRTKAMCQNVAALAAAAWDQSWTPADFDKTPVVPTKVEETKSSVAGAGGGNTAYFNDPVAGTEDDPVYQSVRYGMDTYKLEIPNGSYSVTLKFNEPVYGEAGKRVFSVRIQGKQVIDKMDMFAKFGKNKAIDFVYPEIAVTNGFLVVSFIKDVGSPCIAGIVVEGTAAAANQIAAATYVRKINCGGKAFKDYEADERRAPVDIERDRTRPVEDFYVDFARASFGDDVAEAAGKLLAKIDGTKLVETTTWIHGPGGIKINKTAWSEEKDKYAFVDEFAGLRTRVTGAVNLERFDYWLHTYRCQAAMGEIGCLRGELDKTVEAIKAEKDAAKKRELAARGVSVRIEMARKWERMVSLQVAAVDTPGELGTIDNIERHNRMKQNFISKYDKDLENALGEKLPATIEPGKAYDGPARIIVPTVRTHLLKGEELTLKLILLDKQPMKGAALFCRVMGKGEYLKFNLKHLGRAVYEAKLPAATEDLEYYIEAEQGDGTILFWPVTAPAIGQTVIVSAPNT